MSSNGRTVQEPARQVPLVEDVDVVVAGGGPAGVAAALAAARSGARTRLIETHGCLGGVWTAGLLSCILDKDNKPGLMRRIMRELDAAGAHNHRNTYDAEVMKHVLERLCRQAGVEVRLHTRVTAAIRDQAGRLSVILTESKSGREAWAGKVFIDCTGDGDLAARAGCGFQIGGEAGQTQPMSLMCLITGVDFTALNAHGFCRGGDVTGRDAKDALREAMQRLGIEPSYNDPTIFPIHDDLFGVMVNHEYGISATDAQQITEATIRAREEIQTIFTRLRESGGIWSNVRVVATAEQIGVREGRRIQGRYVVSADDLKQGRTHEDAVCHVTFGVDVHATDAKQGSQRGIEAKPFKAQPYDIPYRALIASDVDGLLLAGRCISGDFFAHASYRVTGNAVTMGQAAGVAAALCAQFDRLPHELPFDELKPAIDRVIEQCEAEPVTDPRSGLQSGPRPVG